MSKIVVFGAGGRAGRRAVSEAVSRGHHVTAVVRTPDSHHDLSTEDVSVVAGDVTDPDSVAAVAAGHDAAISAAAQLESGFFVDAAHALLDGLRRTDVRRLVLIGIGTTLETAPGVLVHDAPDFPADARAFSMGHLAELDVFRSADTDIDWLVIAPPLVFLDVEAERTGRYRIGGTTVMPDSDHFSYADLAVALVDEIETPQHHKSLVAVAP